MRLIKFGASWCKPCETQSEILESNNIEYTAYDADLDEQIFAEFGIRNVPTLLIVGKDNEIIHRFFAGVVSAEDIKDKFKELENTQG